MRLFRAALTLIIFALVGLGAWPLALVAMLLRGRARRLAAVRCAWRLLAFAMERLGLIGVEAEGLRPAPGCLVVANHPSLLDVVLLTALIPDMHSAAKRSLRRNIFVGPVVCAAFLPDDERLLERARAALAAGGSVLIFPEGTRSRPDGSMREFRRGAAQLALHLGAPILPIGIWTSRGVLGKGQSVLDVGARRVMFRFRAGSVIAPRRDSGVPMHRAARLLTARMRAAVAELARAPRDASASPGKG